MVPEGVIEVLLPRHGQLGGSATPGAGAEGVRETRRVGRERLGHVQAFSEDPAPTAHPAQVLSDGSSWLGGKHGKCNSDDWRRPARKPGGTASAGSSQLSPKGSFERKAVHI